MEFDQDAALDETFAIQLIYEILYFYFLLKIWLFLDMLSLVSYAFVTGAPCGFSILGRQKFRSFFGKNNFSNWKHFHVLNSCLKLDFVYFNMEFKNPLFIMLFCFSK